MDVTIKREPFSETVRKQRAETGRRIRECRKERGFTQESLGYALGVNKSTIQRYEIGAVSVSIVMLRGLADVLNVSVGYLTSGIEEEKALAENETEMLPVEPDVRRLTDVWECAKCKSRIHLGTYEKQYDYDFCACCGRKVKE